MLDSDIWWCGEHPDTCPLSEIHGNFPPEDDDDDDDELHLSCLATIPRLSSRIIAVAHGTRTWGGPGGVMCKI